MRRDHRLTATNSGDCNELPASGGRETMQAVRYRSGDLNPAGAEPG
jgi:hypothetical protein